MLLYFRYLINRLLRQRVAREYTRTLIAASVPVVVLLSFLTGSAAEVVTFDRNWAEKPRFNVVSETPTGIEIVFSTHKMVVEERVIDGVPMKSFGVPSVFIPREGAPNLNGVTRFVAIPQGAEAVARILDERTEVYRNVEVAPAPNIPLDSDDSPLRYVKDTEIYGRNAYYPSSPVRLSKPMKMRGVDVVKVGIMPFQYNPVTKDLTVYKDIRVRVDFVGGNGHFGEDRLRSRFWEPVLQGHLLNYNSLPRIDFYAPRQKDSGYGYEYIIIVPDDEVFEAWGDTIKAWRKLQGISCEVFSLGDIGSGSSDIEDFLDTAYSNWDPAPVAFLLLADHPDIVAPKLPIWGVGEKCASDNAYADTDGDDLPDMHHARITAETESDLATMINKFLSYERSPNTDEDFYDNPLLACGWEDGGLYQVCAEVIRGFFDAGLDKNSTRQYNISSGTPEPGCPWSTAQGAWPIVEYWYAVGWLSDTTNQEDTTWWSNGSASGINDAINSGAFLVVHRDHGIISGWQTPSYHKSDLGDLANLKFPFVFSINCQTGMYDYSTEECFAETLHAIGVGALGVNAASQKSWSFVNDTYLWGMYDSMWPQFDPDYPNANPLFGGTAIGYDNLRPCVAMTSGKYYLEASCFPDSAWYGDYTVEQCRTTTYRIYHHHGDAFTVLYSEIPESLTVAHESMLFAGEDTFTVTANDSAVIALTVGGQIIAVAEGTGSALDIPIPAQTPGDTMIVTITKANYYRYEEEVLIGTDLQGEVCDGDGGPLTPSGSPYFVIGDVTVPEGDTLTIQAGAQVRFVSGYKITANGTLNASGTSANPIYLIRAEDSTGTRLYSDLQLQNGAYFKPAE